MKRINLEAYSSDDRTKDIRVIGVLAISPTQAIKILAVLVSTKTTDPFSLPIAITES